MKKITSALLAIAMLVSLLAAFVLPVSAETYPSVTTISTDASVLDLSVNSLEDLNFVADHNSEFTTDHTIHFTTDIALEADSAAQTKMLGFKGSIDGGGHTLSGIAFSGSGKAKENQGWLGTYAGTSIKNITFDDCHATDLAWQGALLMFTFSADKLTLENVTVTNCSAAASGTQNGLSVLVGIQDYAYSVNKKAGELVLTNIRVEDCVMDCKTKAGNSGFVIGRVRNGTTLATNIYVLNNTTKLSYALGGSGFVFGEVTNSTTLNNCAVFNNSAEYDGVAKHPKGIIAGMFKDSDTAADGNGQLVMDNIMVANNGSVPATVYRGNETGVQTVTNFYSDVPAFYGTNAPTDLGTVLSGKEILRGDAAYALNAAGVSQKWVINPQTGLPDFYTDGDSLPYEIIFNATGTDSSNQTVSSTEKYYTDTSGKLYGNPQELFKYATWSGITLSALQQTTFSANASYTGTLRTVYKVMDQNLLFDSNETQKGFMIDRIETYDPDIILAQEGSEDWINYFYHDDYWTFPITGTIMNGNDGIASDQGNYTLFYKYRNDKESCPILYKKDLFTEVDSGYFWISETPDVESKGWDGLCYRICTWMVLEDNTTKENVIVASFHLDNQGDVARIKGAEVVRDRLAELQELYPGSTLITAADINSKPEHQAYAILTSEWADTRHVAVETDSAGTHNNTFESTDNTWPAITNIYDYIFTDIDTAKVLKFDVLDETYQSSSTSYYRPSDHNGLLATIVSASDAVASTCDHVWTITSHNNGKHTRTCTAGCGSTSTYDCSYRYTYVDGVNHTATCAYEDCGYTFSEACVYYTRDVEATCTEDAYTIYTCKGCGNIYNVTDEGSAGCLWTSYTNNGDGTHSAVCSRDDSHTLTEAHTLIDTVVPPTCTEEGSTIHTCELCDYSYEDTPTPKTAHSYESVVTAPTCTTQGYTTHTCTACGDTYTDSDTAMLPHSYTDTVVPPTCTTQGYTTHTCTVCGDTYTDSNTAMLPHSYTDTVVPPTCTTQGYTTHTCTVCGNTYNDTYVDMLPHTYVWDSTNKVYACSCGAVHSGIDVNNDGFENTADVVMVCRYIVGYTDSGVLIAAMDYNKDGRVSIIDGLRMLRFIMS